MSAPVRPDTRLADLAASLGQMLAAMHGSRERLVQDLGSQAFDVALQALQPAAAAAQRLAAAGSMGEAADTAAIAAILRALVLPMGPVSCWFAGGGVATSKAAQAAGQAVH